MHTFGHEQRFLLLHTKMKRVKALFCIEIYYILVFLFCSFSTRTVLCSRFSDFFWWWAAGNGVIQHVVYAAALHTPTAQNGWLHVVTLGRLLTTATVWSIYSSIGVSLKSTTRLTCLTQRMVTHSHTKLQISKSKHESLNNLPVPDDCRNHSLTHFCSLFLLFFIFL